jgi:hypothetical protein
MLVIHGRRRLRSHLVARSSWSLRLLGLHPHGLMDLPVSGARRRGLRFPKGLPCQHETCGW